MKKIPLSQGLFALVDDEDYEWLSNYKWFANKSLNGFYAARNKKIAVNKWKSIRMHCQIIGNTENGLVVDHVDLNGLNNQKSNLRICTHRQNCFNSNKKCRNRSGFKGVCWDKNKQKWLVRVQSDYGAKHVGRFDNLVDAARAYDAAAKKYHGEFARLNFPDE